MESSDSGLSTSEQSSSPAFARPAPDDGPKTVINPERRGKPKSSAELPPAVGSSIWHRLFPPEGTAENYQLEGPAGLELGHFKIEERIGVGGMGAVFRALDTRLQRIVALKVLSPAQSRDSSSVQRFRNEGRAAAKLDHDNIARVYYIGEDQGLHFIAFEYIIGINVRDLIRERGQFSPNDAVNYVLQIASALRHTSESGVVHRDIKPSNIIINDSGRAKLVDLGLARKETTESADLTLAGTTLGTFDYISPEQAKDPRNVDVRSDIYSLGCTLYHMLAGEPPYPEGTVLQKLLDHQGKEPPDPSKKNRRVSDDLAVIVKKMMASDPKRRYPTPDQLVHDLMLVAGQMGLRSATPEGLVWMSSQSTGAKFWERNLGWITTVVILMIVFLASDPLGRNLQKLNTSTQDSTEGTSSALPDEESLVASANGAQVGELNSFSQPESSVVIPGVTSSPVPNSGEVENSVRIAATGSNPSEDVLPPLPAPPVANGSVEAGTTKVASSDAPFGDPELKPITGDLKEKPLVGLTKTPGTTSPIGRTPIESRPPAKAPTEPVTVASNTPTKNSPSVPAPNPFTKPVEESQPISVIGADGTTGKSYRTLEAACAEAEDGSVIELRFDGIRRETPIKIAKKKITLRAAKDFRPTIEFVPEEIPAEGFQTRMIEVSQGSINLINVNLLLSIPTEAVAEQLAIFSLQRPDQFRLQKVTVTINNSTSSPVAIAELISEPGKMLSDMKMMKNGSSATPFEFYIKECVLRGSGDLFLVKNTLPGRFTVEDSLLSLSGSLLHVQGGREPAPENAQLELRLEHVSSLLGQNLIKMNSGDLPNELITVHVTSARNNLFTTNSENAFVSMTGNTDDEDFRRLFLWNGERNFYDQYQTFWSFPAEEDSLDFEKWKQSWGPAIEVGARNEPLLWSEPVVWRADEFKFSNLMIENFTLDQDALDNPAVAGATDGSDAGVDHLKLPLLPAIDSE